MICVNCGAELPDNSIFCFICGENPERKVGFEFKVKNDEEILAKKYLKDNGRSEETENKDSEDSENVDKEEPKTEEIKEELKTEEIKEEAKPEEEKAEEEPKAEEIKEEAKPEEEKVEEAPKVEEEPKTEEVKVEEEPKTEEIKEEAKSEEVKVEEAPKAEEEPKTEEVKVEEVPKTEEIKEEAKPEEEKVEEVPKAEEEPKTEEVKVEEPPKAEEEPKTEEVKVEEPPKAEEEPKTEEVRVEEAPKTEEAPKDEEPKAEEVKVEEPPKAEETPKTEEAPKAEEEPKPEEVKVEEEPKAEEPPKDVTYGKLLDEESKRKLGIHTFYKEHIDYEAIKEQRTQRNEKIMQMVTAVAAVIIIGIVGFKLYGNHKLKKEYNEYFKQADMCVEAENYDGAIGYLKQALEHELAEPTVIAQKISDIYVIEGDYAAAAAEMLYIYNNVNSDPSIYSVYKQYNAMANDASDKKETSAGADVEVKDGDETETSEVPEETLEPTTEPTEEPTPEPTEEPVIESTEKPTPKPTVAPTVEPEPTEEPVTELTENIEKSGITVQEINGGTVVISGRQTDDLLPDIYTTVERYFKRNVLDTWLRFAKVHDLYGAKPDTVKYLVDGYYVDEIQTGVGMAAYTNGYYYFGNFENGLRNGKGIYFAASIHHNNLEYYIYNGYWKNDLPEGNGTITYVDNYGESDESSSVTVGTFSSGLENGVMKLKKVVKGNVLGIIEYTAENGVPKAMKDQNGSVDKTKDGKYVIGVYTNGDTMTLATVEKGIVWKVQGLN